jgi:hypothetical protein
MGRKEFYGWVEQMGREYAEEHEQSPDSWKNTDNDGWWQEARRKRDESRGR